MTTALETEYSKEFFQRTWGPDGYYEVFSYGVGIDAVCSVALSPFFDESKCALEIGCGGGVFTERMAGRFRHLTGIDVIAMPGRFREFARFLFIELPSRNYDCAGVPDHSIDFTFSYNVFCHLSNDAIEQYIRSVSRVSKQRAAFVFMLSNFEKITEIDKHKYKLGDPLPMGHYCQSVETVSAVVDRDQWDIVSSNLIPEHRDIIVHLQKK